VIAADAFTVRVAALEVNPPGAQLESCTLYWLSFIVVVTALSVNVAVVAPLTLF